MAEVDIDTLTIEQYLALSQENQASSVVKPKIGGNVNFEIKSQFMRELREDTFSGNKDEDAHGAAKRWVDRLAPGTINTWDLLKKAFIQRYYLPSMTAKELEDIHNFKQDGNKSLYQAWEWYNDLLYKCPTHDINSHQKLNIFYKVLSTMNRELLDSQGPILGIRPAEALTTIQTMADHSQKWHDDTTSMNIRSSSSKDGLVGCQICEGPHLDKDCPLNEEVKQVKESRVTTLAKEAVTKIDNIEDCKAIFTNDGAPLYTLFYYSPEEIEYFLANFGFSDDEELKNVTSIPNEDLKQTSPKQTTTHYVEPYAPSIPFPKRLEQHAEEALIHKTMESLKKIKSD
ncbi:hypothetical protein Tco_0666950 [Tanacetum coccineum]